jgi:hypothetical protein
MYISSEGRFTLETCNVTCPSVRPANLVSYCERGLAVVQSASRQPFRAEVLVRSHVSPRANRFTREIYYDDGKNWYRFLPE